MWLVGLIGSIAVAIFLRHLFAAIERFLVQSYRSQQTQTPQHPSNMNIETARQILNVSAEASPQDIKKSYHHLMQKLHPDAGGNDYLAGQLNQARDILLAQRKEHP